jgi:hypothetical protein
MVEHALHGFYSLVGVLINHGLIMDIHKLQLQNQVQ